MIASNLISARELDSRGSYPESQTDSVWVAA
jgi:hypothetical protein